MAMASNGKGTGREPLALTRHHSQSLTASAKAEISGLIEAALEHVRTSGEPIEQFRGTVGFDIAKDETFRALQEFGPAATAIAALPLVAERYGVDDADRLALQFIYQMLERSPEPGFDQATFETLWEDFCAELEDPDWLFRAVANLRYCRAGAGPTSSQTGSASGNGRLRI